MIEHSLPSLTVSGLFHGYVMTSAWIGIELLAIWSLYFRNRSKAVEYIHGAAMTSLMLLTAIGAVQILTFQGVGIITKNYYHNMLGLLITCSVPIVALLGITVSFKQISCEANPKSIDKFKLTHKTLGWVFIAVSRIPMYNKWIYKIPTLCIILFIFDILSHSFYFYCKITQIRLESVLIKNQTKQRTSNTIEWIRQIKFKSDLEIFQGDYFIFADYVYRLGGILTAHPAGFQIIDNIRGRQVDRFLYGVESLQFFPNFKNSHTAKSIELAGDPIGKIQDCRIFPRMKQSTKVQISINKCQNGSKIHLIYIKPFILSDIQEIQEQSFFFQGYTDISQLGKYYTLTIHNKSRLYSVVNFLRWRNIVHLQILLKTKLFQQRLSSKNMNEDLQYLQENCFQQVLRESLISDNKSLIIKSKYSQSSIVLPQLLTYEIPLLIKKYDNGQITPYLLNDSFKKDFFISKPRGRGLALQDLLKEKKSHNIYMFSGGTGLNIYVDLIDLLFKDLVMKEQKDFANKIIDNDPILNKNPFEGLNFTFYISVETIKDIHPLTLLQLEMLSYHKRVRATVKSSVADLPILKQNYPHIQFNNSRYENIIWSLKKEEVSKLYFCGPHRMTKAILVELRKLYWSPQKYYIL